MKDDDFVQPIQELGLKHALRLIENLVAHRIVIVPFRGAPKPITVCFFSKLGADVRSHDDDRVPEIDLAA